MHHHLRKVLRLCLNFFPSPCSPCFSGESLRIRIYTVFSYHFIFIYLYLYLSLLLPSHLYARFYFASPYPPSRLHFCLFSLRHKYTFRLRIFNSQSDLIAQSCNFRLFFLSILLRHLSRILASDAFSSFRSFNVH